MRHTLPRRLSILHGNIESIGLVDSLQCLLDACDGDEEVGDLIFGEVGEVRLHSDRRDEDVAGQQRLEVDDGEGVFGDVEDLPSSLAGSVG